MGMFKKGVLRKLWSDAKAAVMKNRLLTEKEKKFMAGFKIDLGPTLDDVEDLLAKGQKSKKLDDAVGKAETIIETYTKYVKLGKSKKELNDPDADHLIEYLGMVTSTMKDAYGKMK